MKKIISIINLATVLLFAVSVMAADRVVVIPLGGTKTVNVANFTGAWQPSTTYQTGQTMQIDGSTYVALVTHTSDPTTPDMGNWSLMAAKGDQGLKGDKGDQGFKGDKGDKGDTGVPGPAGLAVIVNDANDSFLGYLVSSDANGSSFVLVNSQNYTAMFSGQLEPNWSLKTGYADANGLTSLCYGSVHYDNSDCTGTYYVRSTLRDNLFHRTRPGIVCGGTITPIVVQPHYIPRNATTTILEPAYGLSSGVCVPLSIPMTVYQAIPNDPAVTGFQNTFTGPFKYVVTAPPAP